MNNAALRKYNVYVNSLYLEKDVPNVNIFHIDEDELVVSSVI